MDVSVLLAQEFKLKKEHVDNIIALIDDGNTIPFIARYRKEMTGSCDDQVLRELNDRLEYLRNLQKRRGEISSSISEQEKMTDELSAAIEKAATLSALEDIYRPFRPKRRTRATIARERGLEPLAKLILSQSRDIGSIESISAPYINEEKGVLTWTDALDGARDIISEGISDDAECRGKIRELAIREGALTTCAAKDEDSVYAMYYEFSEPVSKIPSHRILAINRGEREGFLKTSADVNEERATDILRRKFIIGGSPASEVIEEACADSWKRLIEPSVEREIRNELTDRASEQAIKMFAVNLKPVLMQPPVKDKVIMGLDPAYRTGCKIAVVDATGKVLDTTVVYPTPPQNKVAEAKEKLTALIKKHNVDAISIGNGTASKESEIFTAELIRESGAELSYMVVNEAGASVYSASKLAAQEFPEFDVSIRSAVSIARRLQDPLAELVKIDPKSIGVGQYQHDMPQARLSSSLEGVVEDCVNSVGVDVNTASAPLLSYISGLNSSVAKNIVAYRDENGGFTKRTELKKVPKLGKKAYEQCAGFLRIPGGKNLLDNTGVHPESYDAAQKLLEKFGINPKDGEALKSLNEQVKIHGEGIVASEIGTGIPTLRDIVKELIKPGRDIRDELPPPMLRTDVMKLSDLMPGMELRGTVRNVIDFGAFVDIGVHQDGLVHISELADRYIKHPSEVVTAGDVVTVYVLSVDKQKKRIALSMKRRGE